MPRLEFFLLAESVSVDQSTNRMSLFNILEEVHILQVPPDRQPPPGAFRGLPNFVAASLWNCQPTDYGQTFRVALSARPPNGERPQDLGHLDFTAERPRQRILMAVVGCPVSGAGQMVFELLLNGNHQASHTVVIVPADLEVAGPPNAEPAQPG
jgi:hypothetical protein